MSAAVPFCRALAAPRTTVLHPIQVLRQAHIMDVDTWAESPDQATRAREFLEWVGENNWPPVYLVGWPDGCELSRNTEQV